MKTNTTPTPDDARAFYAAVKAVESAAFLGYEAAYDAHLKALETAGLAEAAAHSVARSEAYVASKAAYDAAISKITK